MEYPMQCPVYIDKYGIPRHDWTKWEFFLDENGEQKMKRRCLACEKIQEQKPMIGW